MAQLTGEAFRALGEQAPGHAHATEQLRREASVFQIGAASYVSNQQAAEAQAKVAYADLSRANTSEDEELLRLHEALQASQVALAQTEVKHLAMFSVGLCERGLPR